MPAMPTVGPSALSARSSGGRGYEQSTLSPVYQLVVVSMKCGFSRSTRHDSAAPVKPLWLVSRP